MSQTKKGKNAKGGGRHNGDKQSIPGWSQQDMVLQSIWDKLSSEERRQLLALDQNELCRTAVKHTRSFIESVKAQRAGPDSLGQATLLEQYVLAIKRLKQTGTYKVWRFSKDSPEFTDPQSFRKYLEQHLVKPELRAHLPQDKGTSSEVAAQRQLAHLTAALYVQAGQDFQQLQLHALLLSQMQSSTASLSSPAVAELDQAVRQTSLDLLEHIIPAISQDAECLSQALLPLLKGFVQSKLGPDQFSGSPGIELNWLDLEKLSANDAYQLAAWLFHRIKVFSSGHAEVLLQINALPEDVPEGMLQNTDLLSISDDGQTVALNPQWLQHLQMQKYDSQANRWYAFTSPPAKWSGAQLAWILGKFEPKFELARPLTHLDELPCPQKALQALEIGLRRRKLHRERLAKFQHIVRAMQLLAYHADSLCLQYDIRPLGAKAGTASAQRAAALGKVGPLSAGLDEFLSFVPGKGSPAPGPVTPLQPPGKKAAPAGFGQALQKAFASPVPRSQQASASQEPQQPPQTGKSQQAKQAPGQQQAQQAKQILAVPLSQQASQKQQTQQPAEAHPAQQLEQDQPAQQASSSQQKSKQGPRPGKDPRQLPDNTIAALLKREELLGIVQTHLNLLRIDTCKERLEFTQKNLAQYGPELKRRKTELLSGQKMKKDLRKVKTPSSHRKGGCKEQDCGHPLCQLIKDLLQEIPALSYEAAHKIVMNEHNYKHLQTQAQTFQETVQSLMRDILMLEDSNEFFSSKANLMRSACTALNLSCQKGSASPPPGLKGMLPPDLPPAQSTSHLPPYHPKAVLASLSLELQNFLSNRDKANMNAQLKGFIAQKVFELLTPRQSAQKLQTQIEASKDAYDVRQAEYRAALIQLEAQAINTACDNPGISVSHELILPLIRQRLASQADSGSYA